CGVVGGTWRWLISFLVGAGGFGLTWWLAEAGFGVERSPAVSIAAMAGSLLATPFGWWASQESSPGRWGRPSTAPGSSNPGHVFVSFSHRRDGGYTRRLAAFLAEAGIPVWFDQEIITGHRWASVIREHIDLCAAFIVIMTPEAEESDWVGREVTHAEKKGKPILPLLLRGEPFFSLANIQHEAVTGGAMPGPQFIQRLRDLVNTVDATATRMANPMANPTGTGTPAQGTAALVRPAGSATDTGAGTCQAQRPLAGPAGTIGTPEVPHSPHGNGRGAQTPPRGIANRRRPIRLAANPRLRRRLWLAAGPAVVILAVAALPFLIGPDRVTGT